ncbi:MAG: NAD(P)-binding protein [Candidatus Dormibacteraceae bacterium]
MKITSESSDSLVVVGSGISGLMTARYAVRAGYKVELFSKSPDPRIETQLEIENESSTFDSKNDQRYITIFEGHPYLELEGYLDKVYPGIANDFECDVLCGGILVSPLEKLSQNSREWLEERSRLNARLFEKNPEDIKWATDLFVSYTKENRAAMEQWFEIMIDMVCHSPQIMDNLSLHANGILRLYDNAEAFSQSLTSHEAEGILIKAYTPQELVKKYPAYQAGVQRGFLAGGAIAVYGLAFAVGTFCHAVVDELESSGVKLNFKTEIEKIIINKEEKVAGIKLFGEREPRVACNYAFHTGAFAGPELFEGIPEAKNKLSAVEGYWITIENADTLVDRMRCKPNKIHGKKSLSEILTMLEVDSATAYQRRFKALGIDENNLRYISPIVDFNNMPIRKNGQTLLGVGSGYVFKGLRNEAKRAKSYFKMT